jgi:signal transduction histidine kinase
MAEGARRARDLLRSVRVRITVAATLVTVVAVSLAGWLLVRSVEDTQLAEVVRRTEDRIDEVGDALARGVAPTEAVESSTTDVFVEVLDEDDVRVAAGPSLSADGQLFVVALGDATGSLVRPPPPGHGPPSASEAEPRDASVGAGAGTTTERRAEGRVIQRLEAGSGAVSRYPLEMVTRVVDTPAGEMTVRAASPVDEVRRSVNAVRRALVVALPGLVLVVVAVAWVLVGRALRPVEAIRSEVEAISGSTIHRRVPEPAADDEIGRLARTMNAMLTRLEAAQVRQRQFVSDASHELRSPVTAIRSDLEVALREGPAADWPSVAQGVLGEEARLERLIDDLLMLAAGDEASAPPPSAPVDLAAIVAEDATRARRVPVRMRPPATTEAVVAGSAGELSRVVTNLVDNAARHARSTVEVGVELVGGAVRLTVDDDGPGIPMADRGRVFERFTRLDEGRARHHGGAGLGLAVVRAVVARHRGRVWIDEAPMGGARLAVELPAAPPGGRRPTTVAR